MFAQLQDVSMGRAGSKYHYPILPATAILSTNAEPCVLPANRTFERGTTVANFDLSIEFAMDWQQSEHLSLSTVRGGPPRQLTR